MFSWANMVIILFLEPRFVKVEKHLLMWKLISNSCTLSRLYFFYRNCPSRYPRQQPISERAETEPVVLCKIKYWASHKNTLGDRPFILPFSHLVPIPNASEFRDAIYLMSLVGKFWYSYKRNSPKHMTVVCTIEDCPWKITTCAIGDSNIVQVHTFRNVHNHCLEDVVLSQPLVRSTRASLVIDDVIRSTPEYQPRQICSTHVVHKGIA